MLFIDILRRSLRSLLSAKVRTILTAFAIAVGAFALTLTLGASNGAQTYADTIVKDNFDPSELIVTNDSSVFNRTDASKPQVYQENFGNITGAGGASIQVRMLSNDDISRLQKIDGVESVRPAITVSLQYVTRDGQKKYISSAQAYSDYRTPDTLAGTIPNALPTGTVLLPEAFVSALGFSNPADTIGKDIRIGYRKQQSSTSLQSLLSQAQSGNLGAAQSQVVEETLRVIAVTKKPSTLVQPGTALYLKMSGNDTQRLNDEITAGTDNYQKYLSAYVKVKGGDDVAKLNAAQAAVKKAGYSAQSVLDTQKTITQVIGVLQGIVTVFGLIAIVASVFGIVNTMYISVLQRTREIGLMKALGMHKRDISKLFLFEAALIGFLGGVIGSGVAIIAGILLNPFISKQLELGDTRLLEFHASQTLLLIASLVVIAIIAGLLPARKAAKLDPIEALRTE